MTTFELACGLSVSSALPCSDNASTLSGLMGKWRLCPVPAGYGVTARYSLEEAEVWSCECYLQILFSFPWLLNFLRSALRSALVSLSVVSGSTASQLQLSRFGDQNRSSTLPKTTENICSLGRGQSASKISKMTMLLGGEHGEYRNAQEQQARDSFYQI